ncbi:SRPBCC family protein [Nocardioides dongkuii]|uniref:SRPBCC family protein n=1 Tax=Nocardioides dongkuii TaxID=2760089 RepID=UPI0015FC97E7|nr:SRPBCC family protein [Nocardioides dongkuii]
MTRTPTGRIDHDDGVRTLVLTRTFAAPIEDVWAAVTEPGRLARWIGTYDGDPASGRVSFRMTAEDGAPAEEMEIVECVPPHTLRVVSHVGEDRWSLELALAEADGVTTLTFAQPGIDPVQAESVGPGWEYYLDRLGAAETGGEVAAIDFDRDYYPAMQEHYRAQATP